MENRKTESYRVLLEGGEGEYEEKRSRFIATVRRCGSEAEAAAFVEEMRKKYWDARHNCYAFCLGHKGELTRCSDDGEPAGTAGRPILEVLLKEGVRDVALVVTRYFGGVLLGTGGLVRAYTRAAQEGLKNCTMGRMRYGTEFLAVTDYNGVGKLLHLLKNEGIEPVSGEYTDKAVLRLIVPEAEAAKIQERMKDATGGRVKFEKLKGLYFVDKERGESI